MDQETIDCLRESAPAVVHAGTAFTEAFYEKLLAAHPEMMHVFNPKHQQHGGASQPKALFGFICDFVRYADNLAEMHDTIEHLANKHCACQVLPEHYPIIAKFLLGTLEEKLNPGEEVLRHWSKAIGVLAGILIARETELYISSSDPLVGGWPKLRKFRVDKKISESADIVSLVLVPIDGKPVLKQLPGQYLTLHIPPKEMANQFTQIRHYSISDNANGSSYRLSIKRHDNGSISKYVHDNLRVGDVLSVTPPFGRFLYSPRSLATPRSEAPMQPVINFAKRVMTKAKARVTKKTDWDKVQPTTVFICAGVGVTSLLPMLKAASRNPEPILWIQAARDGRHLAFQTEIDEIVAKSVGKIKKCVWLRYPTEEDKQNINEGADVTEKHFGPVELRFVFPEDKNDCKHHRIYLCGSEAFMREMAASLMKLGVEIESIIYESYGPRTALIAKPIPVLPTIA